MNNYTITTDKFWDCNCEVNYIHSKDDKVCSICGAKEENQPSSIIAEVKILFDTSKEKITKEEYIKEIENGILLLENDQEDSENEQELYEIESSLDCLNQIKYILQQTSERYRGDIERLLACRNCKNSEMCEYCGYGSN
jgi:hypothetical protein